MVYSLVLPIVSDAKKALSALHVPSTTVLIVPSIDHCTVIYVLYVHPSPKNTLVDFHRNFTPIYFFHALYAEGISICNSQL